MSFDMMIKALADEFKGEIVQKDIKSDNYAHILLPNNMGIGFRRT